MDCPARGRTLEAGFVGPRGADEPIELLAGVAGTAITVGAAGIHAISRGGQNVFGVTPVAIGAQIQQ